MTAGGFNSENGGASPSDRPIDIGDLDDDATSRRISILPAAIGFLLLIAITSASAFVFAISQNATQALETLLVERARVSNVIKSTIDAETGQRGFILTNREAFLAPYKTAMIELPKYVDLMHEYLTAPRDKDFVDGVRPA